MGDGSGNRYHNFATTALKKNQILYASKSFEEVIILQQ